MIRVGTGFDAHRFADGRKLVLGGVTIPHPLGLEGHSDADVLCHAIVDALLGATAQGDIGRLFPDTDPAWKDAVSLDLLRRVAALMAERSTSISNVDATIIAEQPRMGPHIEQMRVNLSEALGVHTGQVSVKATTVEGMGALGRGEGIAAMAVVAVDATT